MKINLANNHKIFISHPHFSQVHSNQDKLYENEYPFAHTPELAGSELIPGRFLETKHEELSFKVDDLLVDFLGRLGSDFLHLFLSLGHHHHRGGRRAGAPKRRRGEANGDGADVLESEAGEGGLGDGREELLG